MLSWLSSLELLVILMSGVANVAMLSIVQRLAHCGSSPFDAGHSLLKFTLMQPDQPYNVTILNRSYLSGRQIVNAEAIVQEIKDMDAINDCWSIKHFVPTSDNPSTVQFVC